MKKNGISIITQGFITVPGGILACLMYKIQGSVLAKADKAKPDPVA